MILSQPNILSADFARNPYPHYELMREAFPLFYSQVLDCYVLSRHADVLEALKNPVFTVKNYEFQSEPLHGRTFIQMDGQEHALYRNIVAPHLRGSNLRQNLVPMMATISQELYATWKGQDRVDFAKNYAARFPILVIVGLLGLDQNAEPHFLEWYRRFVDFIADLGQTPAITEAAFKSKEEISAHLLPLIRKKRENPEQDLLSHMSQKTIEGKPMDDVEIKAFVSLLITAGAESTDKMLALTLRNLLLHPEQMQAIRENRELISAAFAESLRYSPVTHRLMRITQEEVAIAGGTIPAQSKVLLLLGSAQRDPSVFQNPDRFDIFRKDLDLSQAFSGAANHVAFGAGRHFCVGAMLAQAEMQIAFNQLFDLTREIHLDRADFPQEVGVFTRGLLTLPIRYILN